MAPLKTSPRRPVSRESVTAWESSPATTTTTATKIFTSPPTVAIGFITTTATEPSRTSPKSPALQAADGPPPQPGVISTMTDCSISSSSATSSGTLKTYGVGNTATDTAPTDTPRSAPPFLLASTTTAATVTSPKLRPRWALTNPVRDSA